MLNQMLIDKHQPFHAIQWLYKLVKRGG
uniref:Uncharacterized protein n=1 Tax=Arundo donax TaxID=35708 RepID=A0A0A9B2X0_ARUDO